MNIYIGHSSNIPYESELYQPINKSELNVCHSIALPHQDSKEPFDSKDYLQNKCDLMVAEVSKPSTGLGIELGWADEYNVPILCLHRSEHNISSSIEVVTENIESYDSEREIVGIIGTYVRK